MTKDREVSTFLIAVLLHLCNTEAKDAYQKRRVWSSGAEWSSEYLLPY